MKEGSKGRKEEHREEREKEGEMEEQMEGKRDRGGGGRTGVEGGQGGWRDVKEGD